MDRCTRQLPPRCGLSRKAPEPYGSRSVLAKKAAGARSRVPGRGRRERGVPAPSLGPSSPAALQAFTPNSNSERQRETTPATRPVRTLSFHWEVCEGSPLPETHSFRPPRCARRSIASVALVFKNGWRAVRGKEETQCKNKTPRYITCPLNIIGKYM